MIDHFRCGEGQDYHRGHSLFLYTLTGRKIRILLIEQTKPVIGKYLYQPLVSIMEDEEEKLPSFIEFDVMRKRAIKKRDLPAGLPNRYVS